MDDPFVFSRSIQHVKAYEEWQCPDLPDNFVESISLHQTRKFGEKQNIERREDLTRDYEKIGLKGSESETSETKCQILAHRHLEYKTNRINWP